MVAGELFVSLLWLSAITKVQFISFPMADTVFSFNLALRYKFDGSWNVGTNVDFGDCGEFVLINEKKAMLHVLRPILMSKDLSDNVKLSLFAGLAYTTEIGFDNQGI